MSGRIFQRTAALLLLAGLTLTAGFFASPLRADEAAIAVDTTGLKPVGADWLTENPFRKDAAQYAVAKTIGQSGYNQNCARCHGLEVKSGGLAPENPGAGHTTRPLRHGHCAGMVEKPGSVAQPRPASGGGVPFPGPNLFRAKFTSTTPRRWPGMPTATKMLPTLLPSNPGGSN